MLNKYISYIIKFVFMNIKDLPIELRELLYRRIDEYKPAERKGKDTVSSAIDWAESIEGFSFWSDVDDGKDVTHYACYPKKKIYSYYY